MKVWFLSVLLLYVMTCNNYVRYETNKDMYCTIDTFHDFKLWGPHTYYVLMCMGIVYRYDVYGHVPYDIYVRHDVMIQYYIHHSIMRAPFSLWYTSNEGVRLSKAKSLGYLYEPA